MAMPFEEKQIKDSIKKIMKKRGLDQQTLAKRLNVSLPTVRRVLTKDRLTVDRLVEICRILEISLNQLISMSLTEEMQHSFIDEKQEEFFSKQPHYYLYLRYLGRGMTPQEIENEFKISKESTRKYLAKLESLGVIKVKDRKTTLTIKWPHTFRFPGPLQKVFHRSIGREMADHLAEQSIANQSGWSTDFFYMTHSLRLSPQNYKKCVSEYSELYKKYRYLSSVDEGTLHWRQLVTAGSIVGIDKFDFFVKVVGPLKNL